MRDVRLGDGGWQNLPTLLPFVAARVVSFGRCGALRCFLRSQWWQTCVRKLTTRLSACLLPCCRLPLVSMVRYSAGVGCLFCWCSPPQFRRIVVGGAGQKAISDEFEAITYQQRPKRSKRLNVWDGADPPGDMSVDTEDLPRGRYEEWRGGLGLCTQSANLRGLTVDIKDPLTACRDVECAFQSPLTLLATEEDHDKEVFDKNRGVKRTLRFDDVTVGREQCAADGMDDAAGSVFYTNPFCTRVLDGPGPGAVRQVMKPGWAGSINGKFHSAESWYGMYVATDDDDESGGFMSIEDGLGAAN